MASSPALEDCKLQLEESCRKGHLEKLQGILDANPSLLNEPLNSSCMTALHIVAKEGFLDCTRYLLSLPSINVNAQDREKNSPLHICGVKSKQDLIALLFFHPDININSFNKNGWPPLHLGCLNGYTELVKFFLSQNYDMNFPDNFGWRPIHHAAFNGRTEILQLLCTSPTCDINIQDKYGCTALLQACKAGRIDAVRFLLSLPNINIHIKDNDGNTAFHAACAQGIKEVVSLLLESPDLPITEKNNAGKTAEDILRASEGIDKLKHSAILKLIEDWRLSREHPAQPDTERSRHEAEKKDFLEACTSSNLQKIKAKLSENIQLLNEDLNSSYASALLIAVASNLTDVVKLLVTYPQLDVNIQDHMGNTALHLSVSKANPEIIEALLSCPSIDLTVQNKMGWSPFHSACCGGYLPFVSLLFQRGIDVNLMDKYGWRPLHHAAFNSRKEIIRLLLTSSSLDINALDKFSWTALHQAAKQGHVECVKLLAESRQLNPNIQNNDGNTPLHLACIFQRMETLPVLFSAICPVDLDLRNKEGRTAEEILTLELSRDPSNFLLPAMLKQLEERKGSASRAIEREGREEVHPPALSSACETSGTTLEGKIETPSCAASTASPEDVAASTTDDILPPAPAPAVEEEEEEEEEEDKEITVRPPPAPIAHEHHPREVEGERDYLTAWQFLGEEPKAKDFPALRGFLDSLGVEDLEDFKVLDQDHYLQIAGFLKLAVERRFKQALRL